jgi:ATP-dependent helicase/nuclease subunit A
VTLHVLSPESQDAESRRVIREMLGETMLVEAGAGTGKTRALVDRYVALVRSGCHVEELIAVTFTEKAAAELRDRIRADLERAEPGGEGGIREALASLDRAQISTIHSFALNLLRPLAAEHAINPNFELHDATAAERRFLDRWHAFLEATGEDAGACDVVTRVLGLGLTTRDLEQLAHALWTEGALTELLAERPLSALPPEALDLSVLRAHLIGLHLAGVPESDLLRANIEAFIHKLDELLASRAEDREALLAAAVSAMYVTRNGQAANWGGKNQREHARDVCHAVCQALNDNLRDTRTHALSQLMPLMVRFVMQDVRDRLRDGELIFDDLILRLRNLLRDSPRARNALRARCKAMLIDEFQDTDPLQVDIAMAFARDPETGALEPGRLFLVGDPKQSIYRFRRADMAIYAATRADVERAGGQLPELALNRRSRGVILEFVNATFASIIGDGDQPAIQPPYRPVYAERQDDLAGPGVAWIGGSLEGQAGGVRTHEARQIAAWCREMLARGWSISTTAGSHAARYRDIAILVPTRPILQPLERALADAGVPFRVDGGSLIYATQDVRDLINHLTAIDDPTDDIAVVAALRSPAYACSDVELAEYKLGGHTFNYLAPGLEGVEGRVAPALLDLRALHLSRGGSLAELVARVVGSHRTVEAGMYDTGNRNAFRRARFVIEQARAFEADQPESLRALVEWLERRAADAILDQEGSGLDDDEDAVRVLTIHGSKGLEFPIVFVAGMGASPNTRPAILSVERTSGDVAVSIGARGRGNFTLGPVDELIAQEALHLQAERDRLLYVAATRARDHLVLSLYHPAKARKSAAQRLIEARACELAAELPELPAATYVAPRIPFADLHVESSDLDDQAFATERNELVEGASRFRVTSATALGRLRVADEPERDDDTEPWARGRAGTHRGRAVHAALQVLPWNADQPTIQALARAQAVAEAIPDEANRIADLLRRALGTEAAARARQSRRAQREVPFAVVEGDITLEGFVDLLLENDDGVEIVDWKTDAISPEAIPRRLQDYTLQAGLYVLGIEAAIGRPVQQVTYVFVSSGQEVSPGAPADLARRARERLHYSEL